MLEAKDTKNTRVHSVYKPTPSPSVLPHSPFPLLSRFATSSSHRIEVNMDWFSGNSDEAQAYDQVKNAETDEHKAKLSHELIAAAASYEAAKAYEKHCEENGKPDSHAKAKEIFAGLSGAFIDRMIETKGLDTIDKQKAKHQAHKKNEEKLAEEYIDC
ncbi:1 concanamycin induced protein c [Mycena venus]|uniref:1 concanamycin induced protein c n=1 Tax=Mycena venus TaxID=2733690 RepID=A0A8H6YSZ5_9AGAR|nr:1 concanamycin induced protein c [Mycena venus]